MCDQRTPIDLGSGIARGNGHTSHRGTEKRIGCCRVNDMSMIVYVASISRDPLFYLLSLRLTGEIREPLIQRPGVKTDDENAACEQAETYMQIELHRSA